MSRFTTAGPLKVDSISYGSLSNFRYSVKPFIKNEGSTATITNIQVELYSNDPWVTQVFPTYRTCADIQPGEIKSPSQAFAVSYDSASFPGYFNLEFRITSEGINYWTEDVNLIVTGVNDIYDQPTEYYLYQNYPNPFNPNTNIKYSVPELSKVKLVLYNVLGEEVRILIDQENDPGNYEVEFNAENIPSGVYFYRLQAGNFVQTRKMILLK